MDTAPAFASVTEAMDMARAALGYLAAADATALSAETQAECLRGLERTDAISTAVRASFLGAFTVGKGYSADADYSARAWLMHKTGITRGAAAWGTVHAGGVGKSRALPGGSPTGSASRRLASRPRSPGPMVSPLRAYRHRASNQRLTVDGPAAGRQLARAVGHHGHSRHDNRAVQAEQTQGPHRNAGAAPGGCCHAVTGVPAQPR